MKPKKPKKKPKVKQPPLKVVMIPMSAWSILPMKQEPPPELSLD